MIQQRNGSGNVVAIENMNPNYGGLYKLNSNSCLVQANNVSGNWYGACGSYNSYGIGIPDANGGSLAGIKDLYIRKYTADSSEIKLYNNGNLHCQNLSEDILL